VDLQFTSEQHHNIFHEHAKYNMLCHPKALFVTILDMLHWTALTLKNAMHAADMYEERQGKGVGEDQRGFVKTDRSQCSITMSYVK